MTPEQPPKERWACGCPAHRHGLHGVDCKHPYLRPTPPGACETCQHAPDAHDLEGYAQCMMEDCACLHYAYDPEPAMVTTARNERIEITYDGGVVTVWDHGEIGVDFSDPTENIIPAAVVDEMVRLVCSR